MGRDGFQAAYAIRHVIRQPENAVSLFQAAYVVDNTSRVCGFATHAVYQFPRACGTHSTR